MTCAIGFVEDDFVHIIADSQVSAGHEASNTEYDKVIINNDTIAVFSGNFTALTLCEKIFSDIETNKVKSLKDDIYDHFIQHVKKELNRREITGDSASYSALFARGGELISVSNKADIVEYKTNAAIGSGHNFARGSLQTTKYLTEMSPFERIRMAMGVAAELDCYTNNNFSYANTKELVIRKIK